MDTWRGMIEFEMQSTDDPGPLIHVAPDESVIDVSFDPGYGGTEGPNFLAWTQQRVYFPACYDGSEWVESVPRNPTEKGMAHVGGG